MNPLLNTDFYKVGHVFQYPPGTELVYSNLTCRSSRVPGVEHTVFFGAQYFVQKVLLDGFADFFRMSTTRAVQEYTDIINPSIGPLPSTDHIVDLHRLGYLPLKIKALPEGSLVPLRVPMLTIHNKHPAFAWLTNYVETMLSNTMWLPITSATIAREYRKIISHYAQTTATPAGFVDYMAHDFSCRGMSSADSAIASGMAHLTSFRGTDTVAANWGLQRYYSAAPEDFGNSVPATEHSVMCAGGMDNELETFRRLIEDVYPNGIVSIVSDTWDLFGGVIARILPALKNRILARNGKVVIRPDSGDPVNIICGDPDAPAGSLERKGVVECLYDIFGGTPTAAGYIMLDPHIGAIYGDSITLQRAQSILSRLHSKGFAAGNVVFGIGSYTYQYVTRDTFGMAIKSTAVKINGEYHQIYKRPKTDDGAKNSARGFLRVEPHGGTFKLVDNLPTPSQSSADALQTIFEDGITYNHTNINEIRRRLQ